MFELTNKNAIVTGASRGIGKAVALKLAALGANVAVVYAGNAEKANETVAEIESLGVKAKAYCCDISSFDSAKELIASVIEEFGGVDILVNNAGIVKNVYQHMMKKRRGRIINLSSVVGLNGNAGQANYAAAKAGIIGMTKSVAKELAARGVTVNAIAPGFIGTDMTAALSDKNKEAIMASIPAKKMGTPDDIANTVAFLASDEAAYITGEVIKVDGGMAM